MDNLTDKIHSFGKEKLATNIQDFTPNFSLISYNMRIMNDLHFTYLRLLCLEAPSDISVSQGKLGDILLLLQYTTKICLLY